MQNPNRTFRSQLPSYTKKSTSDNKARPQRSKSLQSRITFNDTVEYDTNNNDDNPVLGGSLKYSAGIENGYSSDEQNDSAFTQSRIPRPKYFKTFRAPTKQAVRSSSESSSAAECGKKASTPRDRRINNLVNDRHWNLDQFEELTTWVDSLLRSVGQTLRSDLRSGMMNGSTLHQVIRAAFGPECHSDPLLSETRGVTEKDKSRRVKNCLIYLEKALENPPSVHLEDIRSGDLKAIITVLASIRDYSNMGQSKSKSSKSKSKPSKSKSSRSGSKDRNGSTNKPKVEEVIIQTNRHTQLQGPVSPKQIMSTFKHPSDEGGTHPHRPDPKNPLSHSYSGERRPLKSIMKHSTSVSLDNLTEPEAIKPNQIVNSNLKYSKSNSCVSINVDSGEKEFDEPITESYPPSNPLQGVTANFSSHNASRLGHTQVTQSHSGPSGSHNKSTLGHIWYNNSQDHSVVNQNGVESYLTSRQYSAFQSVSKPDANHLKHQLDDGKTVHIRDQPSGESKPTTPNTEPILTDAEPHVVSTDLFSSSAPSNEMDESTLMMHPEFHLSNPRDAHFYDDIIKNRPKIASRKLERNKPTKPHTDSAVSQSDSPASSSTSRARNKPPHTDLLHQSSELTPTPPPLPKKQRSVRTKDSHPSHTTSERHRDSADGSHCTDRDSDGLNVKRYGSPNRKTQRSRSEVEGGGSDMVGKKSAKKYLINSTSSSSDVTPPIRNAGPIKGHHNHLQDVIDGLNTHHDTQPYRKPSPGSSRRSSSSTERSYKAQLESAQRALFDPMSATYKPPSPNYNDQSPSSTTNINRSPSTNANINQSPSTNSNINQSPHFSSNINQLGSSHTEHNDQNTSNNQSPTVSLGMTHHASYIPPQQESSSPIDNIAAKAARRLSMPTAYECHGTKQDTRIRQEGDSLQYNGASMMVNGEEFSNQERSIMETSVYDNDRCTTPSLPALTDSTDIESMVSSYHAAGKRYPYQRSSSVNERLLFSDIHQPQLDDSQCVVEEKEQAEHGGIIQPGELYVDVYEANQCASTRGDAPAHSPTLHENGQSQARAGSRSQTRRNSQSHTRVTTDSALEGKIAKIERQLGDLVSFLAGPRNTDSKRSSMSDSITSSQYSYNTPHHCRKYRAHRGRAMETKANNKRFQRIESHIVTLARSIEHISKEMRSFNTLYLEVESLSAKVESVQQANHTASTQSSLSAIAPPTESNGDVTLRSMECKNSTQRISKLTKFFGQEPPMMGIFLKQLGYEQYTDLFDSEKIGMLELPYMTEEKLRAIGVPLGPRTRILEEAQDLRLNMTPIHLINKRPKHRTPKSNKS